jgi:DNA recombination protein RmuC
MFSAFRRDVKKRIEEIHKKYILPAEGTFDFALMYVPSEGVYHELLADAELTEFSRSKRVISVGPNSLFAYLQNIVVSLRGQEVNKMAGELLSMIQGIKQDSDKFGRHLEVLENHIKNAGNTMGTAKKEYDKLSSSIHSAAKLELGEIEKVERLLE